ncbi:MAG: acyl carrier protein [Lachnospiraceae bacterium]|nr:acyl carrier protein [Lachnospiraceae bacterium]
MEREEIIERLKEILLSEDDRKADLIENCTEDMSLAEDLGFNSVALLYMVIDIEESFGIRFENVGINDFETLGEVVDYIEEQLG